MLLKSIVSLLDVIPDKSIPSKVFISTPIPGACPPIKPPNGSTGVSPPPFLPSNKPDVASPERPPLID